MEYSKFVYNDSEGVERFYPEYLNGGAFELVNVDQGYGGGDKVAYQNTGMVAVAGVEPAEIFWVDWNYKP